MSSFGVTPEGFSQKELTDIQTEINDDLTAAFGPDTNVLADAVFGQFVGIVSDKLAENWEVLAAVYRAKDPDGASDEAQDNVAAVTGVIREAGEGSTVTLDQIFLDGSVTLPTGRIVSVGENGNRFVTDADVTNPNAFPTTVSVEATSEQTGPVAGFADTINNIVTPFTGWDAQAALTSGNAETYALSDGQTLTVKVDDGAEQTATFNTGDFAAIGAALAAEVAAVIATDIAGATAIDAGGSPRIQSDEDGPGSSIEVTGGTANAALGFATDKVEGFNTDDVTLGRDIETDAAMRDRREDELRASGNAALEAIRADVLQVVSVLEAFVFENNTSVTNIDGVPPKSDEVVVHGPAALDAEIAQAIFGSIASGIEPFGSELEVITDSQGFDHDVGFSRAAEIDIFQEITVTTNTDPDDGPVYPVDGDAQVAAALAAFGNTLGVNKDVIAERIKSQAFTVSGVLDITAFDIGLAPSPVGDANIPIGTREISRFSTGDIVVTS